MGHTADKFSEPKPLSRSSSEHNWFDAMVEADFDAMVEADFVSEHGWSGAMVEAGFKDNRHSCRGALALRA